jgi:hypothetical protein
MRGRRVAVTIWEKHERRRSAMAIDQVELGLSEQQLRTALEEELIRAMHAEGDAPTVHALAHSVARVIALDHLRIAEQLDAAGVTLEDGAR